MTELVGLTFIPPLVAVCADLTRRHFRGTVTKQWHSFLWLANGTLTFAGNRDLTERVTFGSLATVRKYTNTYT